MSPTVDIDDYSKLHHNRSRRHSTRRNDFESRHADNQNIHSSYPAPEPPYISSSIERVRHPTGEGSDYSVEEIRREFPPENNSYYKSYEDWPRPPTNKLSAERETPVGEYRGKRHSYIDADEQDERRSPTSYKEIKPRRRSLTQNEIIMTAVGGAALLLGGKELWDRRKSNARPVTENTTKAKETGAARPAAHHERAEVRSKHANRKKRRSKVQVPQKSDESDENDDYHSEFKPSSKTLKSKGRRKSIVEGALDLAGLGATVDDSSDDKRTKKKSSDSSLDDRRRRKSLGSATQLQKVARAALFAGATEAFRVRRDPGGWTGDKGKRILTAAIGAGTIDAVTAKNSKFHVLEAVIGGLAGNSLVNGKRNQGESRFTSGKSSPRSRSRSCSRGRSGDKVGPFVALASAGLSALGGSKPRSRSRSKPRSTRNRGGIPQSSISRSPSHRRHEDKHKHKRSKSATDLARKGLAALGISDFVEPKRHRHTRRNHKLKHDESDDDYAHRNSQHVNSTENLEYGNKSFQDTRYERVGRSSTRSRSRKDENPRGHKNIQRNRHASEVIQSSHESDYSLGSSTGEEKQMKKMKGKQILTAVLATISTIHAAHNIYQGLEKRDSRHSGMQDDLMSPEIAKNLKSVARLQNAASIGIVALGIKSAVSEIREAYETRAKYREFQEQKEERHRKRLERLQEVHVGSDQNRFHRRRNHHNPCSDKELASNFTDKYSYNNHYSDAHLNSAPLPAPPIGDFRR